MAVRKRKMYCYTLADITSEMLEQISEQLDISRGEIIDVAIYDLATKLKEARKVKFDGV